MITNKRKSVTTCALPQELVIDILPRLPVKALIRFMCVSKQWCKLISSVDSGYVKEKHDMRIDQTPNLVVWSRSDRDESEQKHFGCCGYPNTINVRFSIINPLEEKLQHRFELQLPGDRIPSVQVCHGLMLMRFKYHYVFNPSTREIVKLPDFKGGRKPSRTGFGYLASKNEYKIIAWFVKYGYRNSNYGCQILTLTDGGEVEKGTWKIGPDQPVSPDGNGLCVNGVIYWFCSCSCRWTDTKLEKPKWWNSNEEFNLALLLFDVEKEECQLRPPPQKFHVEIIFPPRETKYRVEFDLVEFEECVCLGRFFHKESIFKLWKFKNDAWEMKIQIKFPFNIVKDSYSFDASLVAYMVKKGEGNGNGDELIFMIKHVSKGLLYYNIRSNTFRRQESIPEFLPRGPCHYETPFLCYDTFFRLGKKKTARI